jgi:Protein of unknown function (DUF3304)
MFSPVRQSRFAAALLVLVLVLGLVACDAKPPGSAQEPQAPKRGKTVGAELTGYNHTDRTIGGFYVNGEWGGNITPGSGGGSFICCVPLPDPWQPGMTVTVRWEDHELKTQERVVPVPQYDPNKVAQMNVHFLRSGEIKVFVGMTGLRHPDYPLKGKEAEMPLPPSQRVTN